MEITPWNKKLDEMFASSATPCQRTVAMFEQYTALSSPQEKEAFVLALLGKLTVSQSRAA
jgi:hypothetical protein